MNDTTDPLERSSIPDEDYAASTVQQKPVSPPAAQTSPNPAKPAAWQPRVFAWFTTVLLTVILGCELYALHVASTSEGGMAALPFILILWPTQYFIVPVIAVFCVIGLIIGVVKQNVRILLHNAVNIALVAMIYIVLF